MPLIVLDRDGVINQDSADYIRGLQDWVPIPGSIEAMAALSRAGYSLAIATNQSGLGRGYLGLDELEAMRIDGLPDNAHLRSLPGSRRGPAIPGRVTVAVASRLGYNRAFFIWRAGKACPAASSVHTAGGQRPRQPGPFE